MFERSILAKLIKQLHFFLYSFVLICLFFSCATENNHVNKKDWPEIKKNLELNKQFHDLKKSFIHDEIDKIIENEEELELFQEFTFSELIDLYARRYDSLSVLYQSIRQTNYLLDEVVELEKAESVSLDADRGFIIFTLKFNEIFEDSVDYMILNYRYIDDYDNEYFSESSKLSHQAAGKYTGQLQSIMTDIFNGQNEIIYLKTNLSAAEVLQKNYGIEDAGQSLEKEYLNEGLKVTVSAVRFADGGMIKRRNGEWKYLRE